MRTPIASCEPPGHVSICATNSRFRNEGGYRRIPICDYRCTWRIARHASRSDPVVLVSCGTLNGSDEKLIGCPFYKHAVPVGNGVTIYNNVSLYEVVMLEGRVFFDLSMVFSNLLNARSEIPRMNELRPTLVRRRYARDEFGQPVLDCDQAICVCRSWNSCDRRCTAHVLVVRNLGRVTG